MRFMTWPVAALGGIYRMPHPSKPSRPVVFDAARSTSLLEYPLLVAEQSEQDGVLAVEPFTGDTLAPETQPSERLDCCLVACGRPCRHPAATQPSERIPGQITNDPRGPTAPANACHLDVGARVIVEHHDAIGEIVLPHDAQTDEGRGQFDLEDLPDDVGRSRVVLLDPQPNASPASKSMSIC